MLHQMVANKMKLPENPESLIGIGGGAAVDEAAGVKGLPDTAQICSCENVTKGDIVCRITEHGATTVNDLKKSTKACTGCGGCTPLVNDLLKLTLESMGHKVKKSLCEHFDFTRQELYDLIRIKGLKTFDDVSGMNLSQIKAPSRIPMTVSLPTFSVVVLIPSFRVLLAVRSLRQN
jgi:nitrite reductase (NADH) large subunit